MENIGIYVHVPFCVRKCPYCDFYSEDHWDNSKKNGSWCRRSAARSDIVCGYYRMQEKRKLISIYFGGGTPSLLEPEEFTEILRHIDAAFKITTMIPRSPWSAIRRRLMHSGCRLTKKAG